MPGPQVRLKLVPDAVEAVIADGLTVVGRVRLPVAVVEVALADDLRRQAEGAGDAVHDVLDDQHPLRTAETAESGVGDHVSLHRAAGKMDVRQVVGVIQMEQRAVGDGRGEVQGPAAVGEQLDPERVESAVVVETHPPTGLERVALAGERHVLVAVQADAHGPAGHARAERGEGGPGVALGFLAAETTAHARAFHDDLVPGQPEHMGHARLDLARVLGGGVDEHRLPVLAGFGPGGVRFQVEMLLAAHRDLAVEGAGGSREAGVHVAAADDVVVGVERVGGDGLGDGQNRGERFILDGNGVGGQPAEFGGFADDEGDELAAEKDVGVGEEDLVPADGADVV